MTDPIQLTELDVITRYSIAVRAASAERSDLIATLRADLAWLEANAPHEERSVAAAPPRRSTHTTPAPTKKTATKPAAHKAAQKAAAAKTTRSKVATKKAAARSRSAR